MTTPLMGWLVRNAFLASRIDQTVLSRSRSRASRCLLDQGRSSDSGKWPSTHLRVLPQPEALELLS